MKIKIDRLENFYKMPERAHYNDSGADCFAIEDFTIEPLSVYAAPLGFGVQLPDGYDIVLTPETKVTLTKELGFTMEELYEAYKAKNEINYSRIEQGY